MKQDIVDNLISIGPYKKMRHYKSRTIVQTTKPKIGKKIGQS